MQSDSLSVLVIDADASVLALIAGILRNHEIRVLLAPSSAEAIQIAERGYVPIDLILANEDHRGAGSEAVVAIRRTRPDTRALYMSASVDAGVIRIALSAKGRSEIVNEGGLVESIRRACNAPLTRTNGSSGPA